MADGPDQRSRAGVTLRWLPAVSCCLAHLSLCRTRILLNLFHVCFQIFMKRCDYLSSVFETLRGVGDSNFPLRKTHHRVPELSVMEGRALCLKGMKAGSLPIMYVNVFFLIPACFYVNLVGRPQKWQICDWHACKTLGGVRRVKIMKRLVSVVTKEEELAM